MLNSNRLFKVMAVVFVVSLLLLGLFSVNWASTEMYGDTYVSTSVVGEAQPETWGRIGLHSAYSFLPPGEEAYFMERLAAYLEERGVGEAVILPSFIDLEKAGEELDAVFMAFFDGETRGWRLSRRGSSVVNAYFLPFKETSIYSLHYGATAEGTSRGWLSKSNFSHRLLDFTADETAKKLIEGLDPLPSSLGRSDILYLEENVASLPSSIAGILPADGELSSFVSQGDSFMLGFVTKEEELESFLSVKLKELLSLKQQMEWVNASGGRRKTTFISREDYPLYEVEVFYSYLEEMPAEQHYSGRHTSDPGHLRMVTLKKRPAMYSYEEKGNTL